MTGWVRMQSSGSAKRSQARVARDAANSGWLGRAPAALAIALKDWRVIPRDLRNFAQMLGPLIMLPVVYLEFAGRRRARCLDAYAAAPRIGAGPRGPDRASSSRRGVLMFSILIFSQIAMTGISMEGKAVVDAQGRADLARSNCCAASIWWPGRRSPSSAPCC